VRKNEIVTIEKIIPGGSGLGHTNDGKVIMVPKVLVGEKVKVAISQQKKNYAKGELLEVLQGSDLRVTAPCPYFERCGGCDFQHLHYQEQLLLKSELLAQQLGSEFAGKLIPKVLAAPEAISYRQRLRYQVDQDGQVGFYQKNSHAVVAISGCLLAEPIINEVFDRLMADRDMRLLLQQSESLELIASPGDDKVIIRLHFLRKPRPRDKSLAVAIAGKDPKIKSIIFCLKGMTAVGPFGGKDAVDGGFINDGGRVNFSVPLLAGKQMSLSFEVGGFCQVNRRQNERLIQVMLDWAEIRIGESLLDLYCGMGNFSLPAALMGAEVTGRDIQRSAIRSAVVNAENNGLNNCNFLAQDAKSAANGFADAGSSFDLVLLDPPRQGGRDLIEFLPKIARDRLIYISCDPATLRRDLVEITAKGFYIARIQGVDMFPQTHHLESIVLLRRS